jgi:hypothetical protein
MDTVVKSRESSRVLDCSSQSPGSCDSSSVCLTDDEQAGSWGGDGGAGERKRSRLENSEKTASDIPIAQEADPKCGIEVCRLCQQQPAPPGSARLPSVVGSHRIRNSSTKFSTFADSGKLASIYVWDGEREWQYCATSGS